MWRMNCAARVTQTLQRQWPNIDGNTYAWRCEWPWKRLRSPGSLHLDAVRVAQLVPASEPRHSWRAGRQATARRERRGSGSRERLGSGTHECRDSG